MSVGANDSNGIYQYGEDDNASPFSTLLNKLASSVSIVVGTLKGQIGTLQSSVNSLTNRMNVRGGKVTASTDSSGLVQVAHGLGKVPSSATVTPAPRVAAVDGHYIPEVVSSDATNISIRFRSIDTPGTAFGNNPVSFYWIAAG